MFKFLLFEKTERGVCSSWHLAQRIKQHMQDVETSLDIEIKKCNELHILQF